jgi:hypothetical protein
MGNRIILWEPARNVEENKIGALARFSPERGCPTRSSQDCQMSAPNPTVLELSNVLRLGQPRSFGCGL